MIRIDANTRALDRALSDAAQRQMPFATARALTRTARGASDVETQEIRRTFDNPIPFTQRGLYMRGASRSRPEAEIGIKKIQAQYLGLQAEGGLRRPEGRAILIPVGARTNTYGNLPRRAVARLLARSDTFSGRVKGVPGIWQRPRRKGGAPKLLVRYEDSARYARRYEFQDVAAEFVRRTFPRELFDSLRQALATAR